MPEKITLTDNSVELLEAGWDGERFWLSHLIKSKCDFQPNQGGHSIIILNAGEAARYAKFINAHLNLKGYSYANLKDNG